MDGTSVVLVVVAFVFGAGVTWVVFAAPARAEAARLRVEVAWREKHQADSERQYQEQVNGLKQLQESAKSAIRTDVLALVQDSQKSLTDSNVRDIKQVVDPMKEDFAELKKLVSETNTGWVADRRVVERQIDNLLGETRTLSNALSKSKPRGTWGEQVLERLLEAAGLQKGVHFNTQTSVMSPDGNPKFTDVTVTLSDGRSIVIDSKVTLVSWIAYTSATDDAARKTAAKQLVTSVKHHISNLSAASYPDLTPGSADFVIMFLPVDAAFVQALETDQTLLEYALKNKVLFAGPTTLLVALRTIDFVWRDHQRNKNAAQIAKRADQIISKLDVFMEKFNEVVNHLQRAQTAYEDANVILTHGRGNLHWQVEQLQKLGVRASTTVLSSSDQAEADPNARENDDGA